MRLTIFDGTWETPLTRIDLKDSSARFGYSMANAGHGLSVTLRESRESLDRAEEIAAANRGKLASATAGAVETWYCEVVAEAPSVDIQQA